MKKISKQNDKYNLKSFSISVIKFNLSFLRAVFYLYALKKLKSGRSKLLEVETKTSPKRFFSAREINSQFHSIYFDTFKICYEPDVTFAIMELLPREGLFVDIGSNWGHHTFTSALLRNSKVICFEPNPLVFNDLTQITKELKLDHQIKHYCKALSKEKNGKVTLNQNSFESGMASASKTFLKDVLDSSKSLPFKIIKKLLNLKPVSYSVDLGRLDEFNFKNIDLIKIDAEGFELDILEGSHNTIKYSQPYVIFEYFHLYDLGFNEYLSFFEKLGYELFNLTYELSQTKENYYLIKGNIVREKLFKKNCQNNILAVPRNKIPHIKTKIKIL